jgi:hypothetical protein
VCRRLGGTERAQEEQGIIIFFYGKGKIHQWGTGFFVHHRIVSADKTVQFISDRTSY